MENTFTLADILNKVEILKSQEIDLVKEVAETEAKLRATRQNIQNLISSIPNIIIPFQFFVDNYPFIANKDALHVRLHVSIHTDPTLEVDHIVAQNLLNQCISPEQKATIRIESNHLDDFLILQTNINNHQQLQLLEHNSYIVGKELVVNLFCACPETQNIFISPEQLQGKTLEIVKKYNETLAFVDNITEIAKEQKHTLQ